MLNGPRLSRPWDARVPDQLPPAVHSVAPLEVHANVTVSPGSDGRRCCTQFDARRRRRWNARNDHAHFLARGAARSGAGQPIPRRKRQRRRRVRPLERPFARPRARRPAGVRINSGPGEPSGLPCTYFCGCRGQGDGWRNCARRCEGCEHRIDRSTGRRSLRRGPNRPARHRRRHSRWLRSRYAARPRESDQIDASVAGSGRRVRDPTSEVRRSRVCCITSGLASTSSTLPASGRTCRIARVQSLRRVGHHRPSIASSLSRPEHLLKRQGRWH